MRAAALLAAGAVILASAAALAAPSPAPPLGPPTGPITPPPGALPPGQSGAPRNISSAYTRIGGTPDGTVSFVLIPPGSVQNRQAYLDAIRDLCSPVRTPVCRIYYWDNIANIPTKPYQLFGTAQINGLLAVYGRDRRHNYQALTIQRPGLYLH